MAESEATFQELPVENTYARYLSILGQTTSKLILLNLEDGRKYHVSLPLLPRQRSRSLVTVDGEIYIVTDTEIMQLRPRENTSLMLLGDLKPTFEVVELQKKLYIIPTDQRMLCFDPTKSTTDNTFSNAFTNTFRVCGLDVGFCATASEESIYAMGGCTTLHSAKRCNLDIVKEWTDIAPMRNGRKGAAAATLGEKIFVMGGVYAEDSVESYDPEDNCWTEISNLNVRRSHFSACVVGNQLYAIGGDYNEEKPNEHTVEIYNGDRWEAKGSFRSIDCQIYACVWPFDLGRDPLQVGLRVKRRSKIIGEEGGIFQLPGCQITLPRQALTQATEIGFRLHHDLDGGSRYPSVTSILECDPPITFEEPVRMKMTTCMSAQAGGAIPVTLLTRDNLHDAWVETEELNLRERNEIEFQLRRCSSMKVVSKKQKGNFHIISDFYIHPRSATIAVIFSKDQSFHDAVEDVLHKRSFVNFALSPHNIIGNIGSKISVAMKCKKPEWRDPTSCRVSNTVLPSPQFKVDKKFFLEGNKAIYFELDPPPPDDCRRIKLEYACSVDRVLQYKLPLGIEWPPGIKEGTNIFNITANQVAMNGGRIYSYGATHIIAGNGRRTSSIYEEEED